MEQDSRTNQKLLYKVIVNLKKKNKYLNRQINLNSKILTKEKNIINDGKISSKTF